MLVGDGIGLPFADAIASRVRSTGPRAEDRPECLATALSTPISGQHLPRIGSSFCQSFDGVPRRVAGFDEVCQFSTGNSNCRLFSGITSHRQWSNCWLQTGTTEASNSPCRSDVLAPCSDRLGRQAATIHYDPISRSAHDLPERPRQCVRSVPTIAPTPAAWWSRSTTARPSACAAMPNIRSRAASCAEGQPLSGARLPSRNGCYILLRRDRPQGSGPVRAHQLGRGPRHRSPASFREIAGSPDGPQAILPYSYAGTMGKLQGASLDRRFFHRLGASLLDRTICAAAGHRRLRRHPRHARRHRSRNGRPLRATSSTGAPTPASPTCTCGR